MPLQHIHIPSITPRLPNYALAVQLQSRLQARLHEYKASLGTSSPKPAPPPTLISFTPAPTYTLGRRQTSPLSADEEHRLRAPLEVRFKDPDSQESTSSVFHPEVTNAPRGGLTTYHGPGQVVFWPVVDLHSPLHRRLTVRDYSCLLEKTTIAALARITRHRSDEENPKIEGFTTSNPGVWVRHHNSTALRNGDSTGAGGDERKIAALGVHLRRHVTGLGVAVNCSMPVAGPESTNPWARIVACGLGDKRVTSVANELWGGEDRGHVAFSLEWLHDRLRRAWAQEFSRRLFERMDDGRT
ncbi:hypothetical protein BJ170DRAFT_688537 [Xylariales sp. AK1849]|nr:hypothetical protein BJ170DRAFT_688537 [Xylariales sp. AK1849]